MNEDQRFGQLLFNMMNNYDMADWSDDDFHRRLFYIDDQDLIAIIKEYKEGTGKLLK